MIVKSITNWIGEILFPDLLSAWMIPTIATNVRNRMIGLNMSTGRESFLFEIKSYSKLAVA